VITYGTGATVDHVHALGAMLLAMFVAQFAIGLYLTMFFSTGSFGPAQMSQYAIQGEYHEYNADQFAVEHHKHEMPLVEPKETGYMPYENQYNKGNGWTTVVDGTVVYSHKGFTNVKVVWMPTFYSAGTWKTFTVSSFVSVNHGMAWGYLLTIKSLHAGIPVPAYTVMYFHIMKGMMKSSPVQALTTVTGGILMVMSYGVAFLGYSMVYGEMGFWATTVIFNLATIIPQALETLYGDQSLTGTAVPKLYTLHYLLGLAFIGVIGLHILVLHVAGSLHTASSTKSLSFDVILVKDQVYILGTLVVLDTMLQSVSLLLLVHGGNDVSPYYIDVTPQHIVPEAYLLSMYGMIKSIPNKYFGLIAMVMLIVSVAVHGGIQ
jgi:quinol-cytochrome oxidoreductase complex cytochrome b subunit